MPLLNGSGTDLDLFGRARTRLGQEFGNIGYCIWPLFWLRRGTRTWLTVAKQTEQSNSALPPVSSSVKSVCKEDSRLHQELACESRARHAQGRLLESMVSTAKDEQAWACKRTKYGLERYQGFTQHTYAEQVFKLINSMCANRWRSY